MSSAPLPHNEAARLRALEQYAILDTPAEPAFDELTRLAALVCNTPSALITMIDAKRQWFKSRRAFDTLETPRELAFCAHTILQGDVLEVRDATKDPRFATNALVTGGPMIRFYAGAPIITGAGMALGSIAVIDYVPRQLDAQQKDALRALSHQIVTQLELRRRLAEEREVLRESALDAVISIDHRGVVLEINRVAETIFGYPRDVAVGRELAELIIPEPMRDLHRAGIARYLATGQHTMMNRRIETTALRADGSTFPVELMIAHQTSSEPPRFTGFIRDITSRRQDELAAREGIARFELVARATSDAVWDWDLRTNAVWWSEGFRSLFGYKPEEVEATVESWTRRVHPDDHERVTRGIFDVIEHGATYWSAEYRFLRADGSYADVLDRGYVIRVHGGTAVRMIGAMVDVTERKRAQARIEESEERYRQLVEDVPDAIFTLSPGGLITSANHATEKLFGWQHGGGTGQLFETRVYEPDRQHAMEVARRVLTGERPPSFELRLVDGSGAPVDIELTLRPRLTGVAVVGVLGVGRDITRRKRLEEQLRQAQKMDAIGQLSGGVAHDFNNLLTVIQCNAMLIGTEDDGENKQRADDIMQASERAASLTRQLLLVSRKQVMQPTTLDLNEVVRNMTRMLERVLGEHIHLHATYATNLPQFRADAGMLEQVLLNLVVNARDAMPRGGKLTVATEMRVIDGRRCVCLRVQDTGTGIAPDVLPRVFEPFFTTKELGKGTGLGLATVYGIVQQHNGWIDIDSVLGEGSTFEVWLPVTDGQRASPGPEAAPTARSFAGTETILVVEDESTLRALIVKMLVRHGYTVMQAPSGVAALEVWRAHRAEIDLVLTDLMMPEGMTGRELAARLREDDPALKVMYSSGYSTELSGPGEPLVEGVNFLQKPYEPNKLVKTIREFLDRR